MVNLFQKFKRLSHLIIKQKVVAIAVWALKQVNDGVPTKQTFIVKNHAYNILYRAGADPGGGNAGPIPPPSTSRKHYAMRMINHTLL